MINVKHIKLEKLEASFIIGMTMNHGTGIIRKRPIKMSLQEKVNQILHSRLNKGDTVVLACSGGKDSYTALGTLLDSGLDLNIIAAHVDHNIRENSFKQAIAVGEFCSQLGIGFELKVLPKGEHNEASLREERLAFLERVRLNNKAKYIITGHTASDQVETILMRLVRGTGTKGLCGITEIRDKFFRPLLKITKEETTEYIKEKGWEIQYDQSNDSNKYTRNRFRNEIIPLLEKENPKLSEAVNKLSESVLEDSIALDELSEQIYDSSMKFELEASKIEFNLEQLKFRPVAITKRILIKAWHESRQANKQLTCLHINLVNDALNKSFKTSFDLPAGVRVEVGPKENKVTFESV